MSDIFMSYSREDLEAARRLARSLETRGWSVFWDRTIPTGKTWREVIGAALADARCVVVLWSQHSVNSHWVLEEADQGLKRRVLMPAFIENVAPPLGFGSIQAADLVTWRESGTDSAIQDFFEDVAGILGSGPVAPLEGVRDETKAQTKQKAEYEAQQASPVTEARVVEQPADSRLKRARQRIFSKLWAKLWFKAAVWGAVIGAVAAFFAGITVPDAIHRVNQIAVMATIGAIIGAAVAGKRSAKIMASVAGAIGLVAGYLQNTNPGYDFIAPIGFGAVGAAAAALLTRLVGWMFRRRSTGS